VQVCAAHGVKDFGGFHCQRPSEEMCAAVIPRRIAACNKS